MRHGMLGLSEWLIETDLNHGAGVPTGPRRTYSLWIGRLLYEVLSLRAT